VTGKKKPGTKRGDGVRVAILDTWPINDLDPATFAGRPFAPVDQLRNTNLNPGFGGAVGVTPITGPMMVPTAGKSWEVFDCIPPRGGPGAPLHYAKHTQYEPGKENVRDVDNTAGHGLFVADILSRLAPNADFSVYRVIGDDDHGDLMNVARAVEHAISRARERQEKLVFNISFAFGPGLARLERGLNLYLSKESWADPRAWISEWLLTLDLLDEDKCLALELEANDHFLMRALKLLFDAKELARENIFMVASAGNDSFVPDYNIKKLPLRAGPRYPAVIEGVLGVSSVKRNGYPSYFSNRDDLRGTQLDGVGAFGEYIRGLYVQEKWPDGAPNVTGWARWSGTSYSAPVASAFAACLLSEGVPADQMMDAIVSDQDGFMRYYLPVFQE